MNEKPLFADSVKKEETSDLSSPAVSSTKAEASLLPSNRESTQNHAALPQSDGVLTQNIGALTQTPGTLLQERDVLTQSSNELTQSTDVSTQSSDELTQLKDALMQKRDALTQHTDVLTKHSDGLSQYGGTLTQNSDTLTQSADTLTQDSGALTQETDALTQRNEEPMSNPGFLEAKNEAGSDSSEPKKQEMSGQTGKIGKDRAIIPEKKAKQLAERLLKAQRETECLEKYRQIRNSIPTGMNRRVQYREAFKQLARQYPDVQFPGSGVFKQNLTKEELRKETLAKKLKELFLSELKKKYLFDSFPTSAARLMLGFEKCGNAPAKVLIETTKLSETTFERAVRELIKLGFVKSILFRQYHRYIITDKGKNFLKSAG